MGRTDLREIGDDAEALALERLTRQGLTLVTRNYRCRLGELDLVMRAGSCLVFVEVRYRQAGSRINALESIGPQKQRKLTLAAARFLARHPRYRHDIVRFDVVAVDGKPDGTTTIRWIKDAFRPGD